MGASLVGMPEDFRDVVGHGLPFLDEIDAQAVSEAVMSRKPYIDPNPHAFFHEGVCFLSKGGRWVEVSMIWLQ